MSDATSPDLVEQANNLFKNRLTSEETLEVGSHKIASSVKGLASEAKVFLELMESGTLSHEEVAKQLTELIYSKVTVVKGENMKFNTERPVEYLLIENFKNGVPFVLYYVDWSDFSKNPGPILGDTANYNLALLKSHGADRTFAHFVFNITTVDFMRIQNELVESSKKNIARDISGKGFINVVVNPGISQMNLDLLVAMFVRTAVGGQSSNTVIRSPEELYKVLILNLKRLEKINPGSDENKAEA